MNFADVVAVVEALLSDPLGIGAHHGQVAGPDRGQDQVEQVRKCLTREPLACELVAGDVWRWQTGWRVIPAPVGMRATETAVRSDPDERMPQRGAYGVG